MDKLEAIHILSGIECKEPEEIEAIGEAIRALNLARWRDPEKELPADSEEGVLVKANAKTDSFQLVDAYLIAMYDPEEKEWILEQFPEITHFWVSAWKPLSGKEDDDETEDLF